MDCFWQGQHSEEVKSCIQQLTESSARLKAECHAVYVDSSNGILDHATVTQRIIQGAYEVAKATKQIVTLFQWEETVRDWCRRFATARPTEIEFPWRDLVPQPTERKREEEVKRKNKKKKCEKPQVLYWAAVLDPFLFFVLKKAFCFSHTSPAIYKKRELTLTLNQDACAFCR
jgi:G protein-coupled receptor kinase-interacting protein 1 C term